MVNKKQTKITVELITKKSVISTRPTMPQEKKMEEKEENIEKQKSKTSSRRKKLSVSGNTVFLKKDVKQLRVIIVASTSETTPTTYVFKLKCEPKCLHD